VAWESCDLLSNLLHFRYPDEFGKLVLPRSLGDSLSDTLVAHMRDITEYVRTGQEPVEVGPAGWNMALAVPAVCNMAMVCSGLYEKCDRLELLKPVLEAVETMLRTPREHLEAHGGIYRRIPSRVAEVLGTLPRMGYTKAFEQGLHKLFLDVCQRAMCMEPFVDFIMDVARDGTDGQVRSLVKLGACDMLGDELAGLKPRVESIKRGVRLAAAITAITKKDLSTVKCFARGGLPAAIVKAWSALVGPLDGPPTGLAGADEAVRALVEMLAEIAKDSHKSEVTTPYREQQVGVLIGLAATWVDGDGAGGVRTDSWPALRFAQEQLKVLGEEQRAAVCKMLVADLRETILWHTDSRTEQLAKAIRDLASHSTAWATALVEAEGCSDTLLWLLSHPRVRGSTYYRPLLKPVLEAWHELMDKAPVFSQRCAASAHLKHFLLELSTMDKGVVQDAARPVLKVLAEVHDTERRVDVFGDPRGAPAYIQALLRQKPSVHDTAAGLLRVCMAADAATPGAVLQAMVKADVPEALWGVVSTAPRIMDEHRKYLYDMFLIFLEKRLWPRFVPLAFFNDFLDARDGGHLEDEVVPLLYFILDKLGPDSIMVFLDDARSRSLIATTMAARGPSAKALDLWVNLCSWRPNTCKDAEDKWLQYDLVKQFKAWAACPDQWSQAERAKIEAALKQLEDYKKSKPVR
jgi:hypothetical protein